MSQRSLPCHPIAGHLPAFLADKLGFLLQAAEVGGDVCSLRLGRPTLLLRDPADIRHVLELAPESFEKTPRLTGQRGRQHFGKGLFTADNAGSRSRRQILRGVYAGGAMARLCDGVVESALARLEAWTPSSVLDMGRELELLAQHTMGHLLCGVGMESAQGRGFHADVQRLSRWQQQALDTLLPFGEYLPGPRLVGNLRSRRRVNRCLGDWIRQRREQPRPDRDLLGLLIGATAPDGSRLDDVDVAAEALTYIHTGYHTIGQTLTWALQLIVSHPQWEERLRAEIRAEIGDRSPVAADLPRLQHQELVIAETLRLFPPTWIFIRIACRDDRLPGGTVVRAGTKLYLSPWVSHRNPRYFPRPELFDPYRFLPENARTRPSFCYFPFGGGARMCIGRSLARVELGLLLAVILQRHRFQLVQSGRPIPEPGFTLHPRGGLPMLVHPA